jgi:hypothetical protein
MKKVVVIGASPNPERYSYKAIHLLKAYGHDVSAIGLKQGAVAGVEIQTSEPAIENTNTVTLYVGAKNQPTIYNYILQLNPQRVIFNPGAENEELENLLTKNNIAFEVACTMVMLTTGQF